MKNTVLFLTFYAILATSALAALPVTDGLIVDLRADSLVGLADGDPVTVWVDSAQDDAADGTVGDVGSGTPEYKAAVLNGKPVVRFNGAEALSSGQFEIDPEAGATVFLVCTGDKSGDLHERMAHFGAWDAVGSTLIAMDVCTDPADAQGSGFRVNNGWSLAGNPNPLDTSFHVGCWQAFQGATHAELAYYLDGVKQPLTQNNPGNVMMFGPSGNVVAVGNGHSPGGTFYSGDFVTGDLAVMLVYNRVLTEDEILTVSAQLDKEYLQHENAVNPVPADGGSVDATFATLSWEPGASATSRNVYLSAVEQEVIDGLESALVGTPTEAALLVGLAGQPVPEGLIPGTTYFWRVDEVSASGDVTPGAVWSFSLPPATAFNPNPVDGGAYVQTTQVLSWEAGIGALLHTVYFGENADEVANAMGGVPQLTNTYTPAEMKPDTTYYWRVDEFTGTTTHQGQVWSFTTLGDIPIDDESLIGYWNMDQTGSGSIVDMSGHGNHGTITGDLSWVDGVAGSAIEMGLDNLITMAPLDVNTNTLTLSAWVRADKVHGRAGIVFMRSGPATTGINLMPDNQLGYHWLDAQETWQYESNLVLPIGEWAFVAMVATADSLNLYLDSVGNRREILRTNDPVGFSGDLTLGSDTLGAGRRLVGAIDEARFYNRALSAAELEAVMGVGSRPVAPTNPLIIDSFDGYNAYYADGDPNVWDVWADGYGGNNTGSTVAHAFEPFMDRVTVQGGMGQSLPLYYENNGSFKVSEISRSFSPAQDFTRENATGLVVYVKGEQANLVEPGDTLYLQVTDADGKDALVTLAPADALQKFYWLSYTVALDDLSGVDLTQITEMLLGIGNPTAPATGGTGMVFIDNIMLTN